MNSATLAVKNSKTKLDLGRVLLLLLSLAVAPGLFAGTKTGKSEDISGDIAEQEVMDVLDNYMASFNALDFEAHLATYHFPHYRLASGRMNVLTGPEELNRNEVKRYLAAVGWHHSQWDKREVSMRSAEKFHVDTRFIRYREDGSAIGSYDSLYILTRENGVWGIKMRSSFAQ